MFRNQYPIISRTLAIVCIIVASFVSSALYGQSDVSILPLATFGEQYGHPFDINRVRSVYSSLNAKEGSDKKSNRIVPTHLYVRFTPSSRYEMERLQLRNDLNCYPYPLDCDVTEGFIGIDNPFLVNGFPQLWAIVPIDFKIESLKCPFEIESQLWCPAFLCNQDSVLDPQTERELFNSICSSFWGAKQSIDSPERSTYYPGGYVKYQDSQLGAIGILGMQVEAYTFWKSYSTLSGSNGYCSFGSNASFTGDFRYRIKFKRDDFCLKANDGNTDIEYVTNSGTNALNILFTGAYATYSVAFQAAQRYYYQSIDIPRPPMNGFWDACLWIHVYPDTINSNGWAGYFTTEGAFLWIERPTIHIYGKGSYGYYTSDSIYGSTIHEMAHAMHYGFDTSLFSTIQSKVKESLARGVELYLAGQRYPSYSSNNLYYSINRYTDVMRDLTDGEKTVYCARYEDDAFNVTTLSPAATYNDPVNSIYTYPELIEAVKTCTTPNQWFFRIYNLYHRLTGPTLYAPFNFWFDL